MKMSELIARLVAAIETPDYFSKSDVDCLLEDAYIALQDVPVVQTKALDAIKVRAWDLMYYQHDAAFFENGDYPEYAFEVINLMDTYANWAKYAVNEKKN